MIDNDDAEDERCDDESIVDNDVALVEWLRCSIASEEDDETGSALVVRAVLAADDVGADRADVANLAAIACGAVSIPEIRRLVNCWNRGASDSSAATVDNDVRELLDSVTATGASVAAVLLASSSPNVKRLRFE